MKRLTRARTVVQALPVHNFQEFPVGIRLHDLVQKEFHGVHGVHIGKELSEEPDSLKVLLGHEQFLFPRA